MLMLMTLRLLKKTFTAQVASDARLSPGPSWHDKASADLMISSMNLSSDKNSKVVVTPEAKKTVLKPVLIINKHDDSFTDKENMKVINKTMIAEKMTITKSFKNKLGNTVFVCDSVEKRNKLRDEIVKSIPDISYKAPPPLRPVVTVVGFDNECTSDDLLDALVDQNHFVEDFLTLNNCKLADHVSCISTKPLKNNRELSQALFRISPTFRQLLKKFYDKVIIGSMRCKIYDRHNVKRCNNCYDFGHFAAECKADSPVCGFCSGSHETSSCPAKSSGKPVCCNCKKSDAHSHDTNHPAYSFNCPVYKSHLNL